MTTLQEPTRIGREGFVDRKVRSAVLGRLGGLKDGTLLIREPLRSSQMILGNGGQEHAEIEVHDPAFYRRIASTGALGAGESWIEGEWTSPDLSAVMRLMSRNASVLQSVDGGTAKLTDPLRRLINVRHHNTRKGSRKNIAAHYDLGNDFFSAMLDPTMTYSCAFFETPEDTLEQAQHNKLDRLCQKAQLQASDHVLEIGTGWGSLAMHAARNYGCRVTTTTISKEQHRLATERVEAAGLADRVEILLEDYRDLDGRYDKLLSCEMIEAVGQAHLDTFVETCDRLTAPNGRIVLQAICIQDSLYRRASQSVDFIKRHIFPGSFIPSSAVILDAFSRRTSRRMTEFEDIGVHYAETLRRWQDNLRQREIPAPYDDPRFQRAWDYYLAYCEGGFDERRLYVGQFALI